MKNVIYKSKVLNLRQKAEVFLKNSQGKNVTKFSEPELRERNHEHEIHQLELEMLNEKLMTENEELRDIMSEKFIEISNLAPSGHFLLAREGRIIELNISGANMLGKMHSDIKNDLFSSFVSRDSKPIFNQFLDKVFNSNGNEACEVTISCRGNSPLRTYITGIETKKGEECIITALNISGQRRWWDLPRETDEYLATLFNYANLPIIIWDSSLKIMRFNWAFENLSGYDATEVLGKNISILFPENKIESTLEFINNPAYGARWESVEIEILRKDKQTRIVLWNTTEVFERNTKQKYASIAQCTDISIRKQALDDLKVSEKRYRRLFESAKDGILILDAETGKITDVNPFLYELLGYTSEQLMEKEIWEIGAFKDVAANKDKFSELQEKKYVRYEDLPLETADGRKINVEFVSNVYLVDKKKVIQCNIRDISKRSRTEELIAASETRYRRLFESAKDGILILDAKTGKVDDVNPFLIDLLGYSKGQLIGKEIWELGFFKDVAANKNKFSELKKMKYVRYEDLPLETADGRKIHVEFVSNVYNVDHHKVIQCNVRDITQRMLSEGELREKELQFRNLANSGMALIWTSDTDKLCNYFNEPWLNFTGRTLEQEIGSGWTIGVHPDDFVQCVKTYRTAFDKHEEFVMEYRLRNANGEYRWIKQLGSPNSNSKDEFIGYIMQCFDITDNKLAELELIEARERAEESDHLKSAFLANMSHEISTPMNGILGFTELLKEAKLTGEQQQKYISIIEKSGNRLLAIINDIISISKVESGQMELSVSETNVKGLLDYIYTFFKPAAQQKGIRLSFKNTEPADETIIHTDREKVYAILTNLVKNAIKFTLKGSIEFGYNKKDNYLEFFVKDAGIGISREQKKIIFDRFRQANDSLTRNYEGAGLGLSISKAYVEMLGGKIWVESQPGNGSTFFFTIPVDKKKEEKNEIGKIHVKVVEKRTKNLKILIVEDDKPSEILITIAVDMFVKDLIIAKTGNEAVEASRKNPDIDLVLMDIQLPEMDGYEAIRQIRRFNKKVIIIAQTANVLSGEREKLLEAGCSDYIPKPFSKDSLREIIRKHFN